MPIIGCETAANKNEKVNERLPNCKVRFLVPHEDIGLESGPIKGGPKGLELDEYGTILREAPVSIK